ncbi:hypothetical protein ScalyP_jg8680 [Parmales sp. scaly parma]|nr:hypothetical protein ScalyP_jg8680 [Parmales sp. scaly parma]
MSKLLEESNPYVAFRTKIDANESIILDGQLYVPSVTVLKPGLDGNSDASVEASAVTAVIKLNSLGGNFFPQEINSVPPPISEFTVTRISGGITNALYRIKSEVHGLTKSNSLLVRVFGGEGMINRDLETVIYASLCSPNNAGANRGYLGRFGNGRVEGWLDGYRALNVDDLRSPTVMAGVASSMASMHKFELPEVAKITLAKDNEGGWEQPMMWKDIMNWGDQAVVNLSKKHGVGWFGGGADHSRALALDSAAIINVEIPHLKTLLNSLAGTSATAFCHNDLLAGNIMTNLSTGDIQLIDFEYGTVNFVAFDIANHFNEWAGGTDNGKPNYDLLPTSAQMKSFVDKYVEERGEKGLEGGELLKEVEIFMWINNIYWGLWAVNQAATEGCASFDYLLYAEKRFGQYYSHSGRRKS